MNTALVTLNQGDLSVIGSEPRILDVRVAERLGFERPRAVRQIIERNADELTTYGDLVPVEGNSPYGTANSPHGVANSRRRGAPGKHYWLNEGQILLLCMLSRTPNAAAVRKEVIEVYMAHRHGGAASTDPLARMTRRQAVLRQAVAFQAETEGDAFAKALAHLPLERHSRRYPKFWSDFAVRRAVIRLHRQVTIAEARAVLMDQFGPDRTPSRSAIHRFWSVLDRVH